MGNYTTTVLNASDISAIEVVQSGNSKIITIEKQNCYFEVLVMLYNIASEEQISLERIDVESSFTVLYHGTDVNSKQVTNHSLMIDQNGVLLVDERIMRQKTGEKKVYTIVQECFIKNREVLAYENKKT